MNHDLPLDPHLRSLEARLSAQTPSLSADRQQDLLYQCAYAAGQKAARAKLRRWRAGAIACAALLAVMAGRSLSDPSEVDRDVAQAPARSIWKPWQLFIEKAIAPGKQLTTSLDFDAWQIPEPSPGEPRSSEEMDAREHSLTVGSLSGKFFER
jgi:hypothetical protein